MKHLITIVSWLLLATAAAAHQTAVVNSITPESPAAAAGLQVGDHLLRLAGQTFETADDLLKIMAAYQPGDAVQLAVQRHGEPVDLTLTFGERPGGGVAIGITFKVSRDPGGEPTEGSTACLGWIEDTYRITSMTDDLELDLSQDYEAIRACVERDTAGSALAYAIKICDNVFKVHCSGLDLLTEIGEAQVARCEGQLESALGLKIDQYKGWQQCAQHTVFDQYTTAGESNEGDGCREALLNACGTDIEAVIQTDEISPQQQSFVVCCSANVLDSESDRCSMIDDGFTRGPCHDQPVCINRLTGEWFHCPKPGADQTATWSQWGGPRQSFKAPAQTLATSWTESGPDKLWRRSLGDGYSAILAEGGRLYTMYRAGDEEAVICLDARTGETVWEQRYIHEPQKGHVHAFGPGPNATPLIAGDLLFTVGVAGKMQALNKSDGEIVWKHDLWGEVFGGNALIHGYSSSPVAYKGTVIVAVGGEKASLVAFDQHDGRVKWRAHSFRNSYSSPRIMEVAGAQQLVVFMAEELIGVNPDDGALLWRFPHANPWRHNIAMPMVSGGDTIFLSSPQAGAKGLRLVFDGEVIQVEEIWSERRVQFYHVSSIRDGDWVYGSTGTASPAFMAAINIRTGEVGWRLRGFGKANCVEADGKLVILDEDGMLYLATATPEALVVHAKTQLLDGVAWTVPTIVGKTMYVRDRQQILAVDLG